MSDLHEVSSDPFANPVQKIFRWLRSDDFRGLSFCFASSSFILTIAMIFEANLGAGPIKQHGVVASSDSACSKFGSDHLKLTRNSYDAAILTSICLLATNPGEVSLGGGVSLPLPAEVLVFHRLECDAALVATIWMKLRCTWVQRRS